MSVVTVTPQGIARKGVDANSSLTIAAELVKQGFERTVWVDYLVKPLTDGNVYLTIGKNILRVEVRRGKVSAWRFTAANPDRLKIRLDQILQEVPR